LHSAPGWFGDLDGQRRRSCSRVLFRSFCRFGTRRVASRDYKQTSDYGK